MQKTILRLGLAAYEADEAAKRERLPVYDWERFPGLVTAAEVLLEYWALPEPHSLAKALYWGTESQPAGVGKPSRREWARRFLRGPLYRQGRDYTNGLVAQRVALSRALSRLEARGLARRLPDTLRPGRSWIQLTAAGREAARRLASLR